MSAGQRAARRAPGVLAVALFAWWALADGGYAPGAWYPGALVLLAALAGCVRPRMLRELPPAAQLALAALAAFTAWSFCSIAWSDARGDAWDGANRTLLYLTVFALFAVVPWTVAEAAAGLGAFALATAGAGAWEIARAIAGGGASVFVDGRLAGPVGYENASAALFLVAFWAALLVAAQRPTPRWARAIMLATAGLLLQLTVLAQSRGALVAGVLTLALALVLLPDRLPLVLSLLAVAAVAAASLPTLLRVYEAAPDEPELGPVAIALGLSAALLFAAGLALERAERKAARTRVPLVRAVAAATVLVTAAGAALAVAAGTPADSRFAAGLGSGRYDFWRVATLEFARHPVGGVGADNFAHDYVRERRRREEPLYPHSLALRAVAQLGAVGAALLALFVGAVAAAVHRLPRGDLDRRTVAVAALVAGAVWLVHGSIDWLWAMPAVAAPAMGCLGLAAGLGPRAAEVRSGTSTAVVAAAAIIACVAALSLALPALSVREVEGAVRQWRTDPDAALRRLERARALNPLTDRPDLVAGALARPAGDHARARGAFLAALDRDERNWHAQVEVALLDLRDGRRAAALARLRRARQLNPREPVIGVAMQTAGRGEQPSRTLLERLSELAVPRPLGRGPVDCPPVLGLGSSCARETMR
jgi:tetratricopeptide (TPR) repeat protein